MMRGSDSKETSMARSLFWAGDFREVHEPISIEEGREAIEAHIYWHGADSVADYEKEYYGVDAS